jgi:amidohydrolase
MTRRSPELAVLETWRPELQAWRRHLHSRPELGFEERETAGFIAQRLRSFGLQVHEGIARTGVVGTLRRGHSTRTISLRAEMDALPMVEANDFPHKSASPGRMHACGHDGHIVMLLAAARFLAGHAHFTGNVHFVFQPAEEGAGGAAAMLEDGLFERFPADVIYGMHNVPEVAAGTFVVKPGEILAAYDTFDIAVRGRGAHAAFPQTGDDSVLAAAQLICAINTIVARSIAPADTAVLSVTTLRAGEARNVIPAEVCIGGSIRTFRPQIRERLIARLGDVCEGIGRAFGVRIALETRAIHPATVNTKSASALAAAVVADTFGRPALAQDFDPLMASEDFSLLLERRPGCYVLLGSGARQGAPGLHNAHYDFNDDLLTRGAAFWICIALAHCQSALRTEDDLAP